MAGSPGGKQAVSFELCGEALEGLALLADLTQCSQAEVIEQLVAARLAAVGAGAPSGSIQALSPFVSEQRRTGGESLYQEAREWDTTRMGAEISARLERLRPAGGEVWHLAQQILHHTVLDHLAFEIERRAAPTAAQDLNELRLILEALHSAGRGAGAPEPHDLPHQGATDNWSAEPLSSPDENSSIDRTTEGTHLEQQS